MSSAPVATMVMTFNWPSAVKKSVKSVVAAGSSADL